MKQDLGLLFASAACQSRSKKRQDGVWKQHPAVHKERSEDVSMVASGDHEELSTITYVAEQPGLEPGVEMSQRNRHRQITFGLASNGENCGPRNPL